MRTISIFISLMLVCTVSFSANCIIDKDDNVVAKINYDPDIADIETRGEAVVDCSDDIVIGDADFRNNKIQKHVKTQKEKDDDAEAEEINAESIVILKKMKDMAIEQLKAEGVTLKHKDK